MMGIARSLLLLPIAASVALAVPAQAQTTASTDARVERTKPAPKRAAVTQSNGHVYLLRGLMNIFSLGMDDLAAKIQARGISASVHNHSEWQALADDIAAKYRARQHGPVVLVGHSLGADAVMFMSEYLGKKGVPVALVVPFDGTGSFAASSNVKQVYNLTQRDYAHMRKGAGFRGTLNNVDVSGQGYGHIDIDKSARLHALVLQRIQAVIRGRGGPATAEDGSPTPRPRQAAPTAQPSDAPAAPSVAPPDTAPAKPAAQGASTGSSGSVQAAAPATTGSTAVSASSAAPTRAPGDAGGKPDLRF